MVSRSISWMASLDVHCSLISYPVFHLCCSWLDPLDRHRTWFITFPCHSPCYQHPGLPAWWGAVARGPGQWGHSTVGAGFTYCSSPLEELSCSCYSLNALHCHYFCCSWRGPCFGGFVSHSQMFWNYFSFSVKMDTISALDWNAVALSCQMPT